VVLKKKQKTPTVTKATIASTAAIRGAHRGTNCTKLSHINPNPTLTTDEHTNA
jgi:hypothetical protein